MDKNIEGFASKKDTTDEQPDALDLLLTQRTAAAAALPDLPKRVQAAVDSREAARLWLKEHPDYFRRKLREAAQPARVRQAEAAKSSSGPADYRLQLRSTLLRLSASGSPRTWVVAGSLLLGAACGYLVANDLSRGSTYTGFNTLGGIAVVSACACALIAAVLSQWRSIRNFLA